jgi:hypothetical protein
MGIKIQEQIALVTKALAAYQAIADAHPDAEFDSEQGGFVSAAATDADVLTETLSDNAGAIRFCKNFGDEEVPIRVFSTLGKVDASALLRKVQANGSLSLANAAKSIRDDATAKADAADAKADATAEAVK